ncbi:MAG: hypothetical protein J2P54_20500, partial [Bradyrhizobiaceae bacterium]|nr:hypothetical protein [Bradyrhizobiaceae bacterium]
MARRSAANQAVPHKHRGEQPHLNARSTSVPHSFFSIPFLWPLVATATASEAAASILNDFAHRLLAKPAAQPASEEPQWATRHRIALELETMRLRDFSQHSDA